MSTIMFFLMCLTGIAEAKPFSGSYKIRQPGITYRVFMEEQADGKVHGVLHTPILSLPLMGNLVGDVVSGDLIGLEKLSFRAKIHADKLVFDILSQRTEQAKSQPQQSLVMLPITDEQERQSLKKKSMLRHSKLAADQDHEETTEQTAEHKPTKE